MLDNNLIAWGTQYELARGVANGAWTWANVRENIAKLQGKSADSAYRVRSVLRGQENMLKESIDLSLWQELDREQDAIFENQGAGLGLNQSNQNWYGGQIQQLARLIGENGNYKIILEPMEKRRSHRFARFYGSRRFLQLRIPEQTLQKESHQVVKFLTRSFVLCGRIFVPFHSKEGSLYMVETDQNYGRLSMDFFGDQYRMPFCKFINWHNPLAEPKNYNQTITKYATRFAIGLSNSVPALEFQAKNIIFIDDITTDDWPEGKPNPPAEKLMTDGCGYINHSALHAIVKHMDYEALPAAVQGRIAGAKGLWILHPDDTSDEPKIWIRNSQNKIKYSEFDRSHRIFDLLGPSRPSSSICLSEQSIVNLFNNGVPAETLIRLMEEGLEEDVAPLMDWDRPHAMVFLWDAINKCGNVSGSRTQRISVALNRALGLKGRDWGRDNDDIDADEDGVEGADDGPTLNTGRNMYSGAPYALHEVAAELIQAGFHPAEMELLYDKIRWIVDSAMRTSIQKYRIPIPESLGAYIAPDYFGVLEEDEIFYQFSKPRKDPASSMLKHTLEGPVIIGRYPIMLGSDMKKVTACYYRELELFQDVVVLPIKGYRSLANQLSDGDQSIVIWAEDIVAPFKNTPLVEQPKDFMKDNFESGSKVQSVRDFCHNKYISPRATNEAFMAHLLANLNDSEVGLYNMMHKNAAIAYGYHDSKTIRLAYIFTTLLDASKTGHRLKQGIKAKDLAKYSNTSPDIQALKDKAPNRDILFLLNDAAKKKADELFERYEAKRPSKYDNQDKDLRSPYDDMFKFALEAKESQKMPKFLEELSNIRAHVNKAKDKWIIACAKAKEKQSPVKGKPFKKAKNEDLMLECTQAYAAPIEGIFLLKKQLKQIKASYAYCDSPKFAFTVAFLDLCHIKAAASPGGLAPSLRIFDDAKTISPSFLRALRAVDEDSIYS
ncbi:RNA-dependent RNA polymerase 1 [Psilocybe cubensis]|uniref:RNA-dependent RNA polymerase 1 n=1 Tax=Psilocybe cubensis TaxID=181762 RepID=A0ACB8HEZ5_PSICU|nr:RNA-dependent RNA polymerase 1 [Psilocybe cubensis]KAH9486232.1 RNA-dependent RNA polymerase 1 [Psilocybe cubensis]